MLNRLQVAIPDNPAIMFASLDRLLAASTAQCSDTGLINALRMVVSLRDNVLEANPRLAGLTPSRLCAILLLYNTSLARLCLTLQCPEIMQLAVQLPAAACPPLRSLPCPAMLSFPPVSSFSTALSHSALPSLTCFTVSCSAPQHACIIGDA